MKHRWKRTVFWGMVAACILLFSAAGAEVSTNLKLEKVLTTGKKVARQTWVDNDGNPVMPEDLGYCTLVNTYTVGTKLAKTEYFDTEGNPCNNAWGFAVRKLTYTLNNVKLEAFFDLEGKPANGPDGYARMETEIGRAHV